MSAPATKIFWIKAKIEIRYSDRKSALAISEAVEPDNLGAPEGTHVHSLAEGTTLVVDIESNKGVESLLSTLEDLVSCVQAAEGALSQCVGNGSSPDRKG